MLLTLQSPLVQFVGKVGRRLQGFRISQRSHLLYELAGHLADLRDVHFDRSWLHHVWIDFRAKVVPQFALAESRGESPFQDREGGDGTSHAIYVGLCVWPPWFSVHLLDYRPYRT